MSTWYIVPGKPVRLNRWIESDLDAAAARVLLATSNRLDGHQVEAEVKKLRESCLRGLRREAAKCGANAVFAIQISCTELSAARSLPMMMMMIASGTAARVTGADDTVNY